MAVTVLIMNALRNDTLVHRLEAKSIYWHWQILLALFARFYGYGLFPIRQAVFFNGRKHYSVVRERPYPVPLYP